jgi:hypothetical protein
LGADHPERSRSGRDPDRPGWIRSTFILDFICTRAVCGYLDMADV